MNKISEDLKNILKKHGSLIAAILLFAATFGITVTSLGSCTRIEVDRYQLGQTVRAIVDGEQGEVVADINGTQYYERDLKLITELFKLTEPEYASLKEGQIKSLAGDTLVKQKMLLHEFDRFSLVITDEEFEAYLNEQKQIAFDTIALNNDESKALTDYISGYGCTYSQYWEDEYVLESYMDNIKLNKVNAYICEQKGYSTVSAMLLDQYLTELIENETYKITLFGEEFK